MKCKRIANLCVAAGALGFAVVLAASLVDSVVAGHDPLATTSPFRSLHVDRERTIELAMTRTWIRHCCTGDTVLSLDTRLSFDVNFGGSDLMKSVPEEARQDWNSLAEADWYMITEASAVGKSRSGLRSGSPVYVARTRIDDAVIKAYDSALERCRPSSQ